MDTFTHPKKSLGQHFLKSLSYCRRIAEFSGLTRHDIAIEIGPGTGQLTDQLLNRSKKVIAIEIDPTMIAQLKNRFLSEQIPKSRLSLIQADVLQFDWIGLLNSQQKNHPADHNDQTRHVSHARVVGNLPYNIATRIMSSMTGLPFWFQSFTFMTQKEVAKRVLASVGSDEYGYFSVLMNYHFYRTPGFDVPAGAFSPPPKVISHVFKLAPRKQESALSKGEYSKFEKLLQIAFQHRRKKLKNNLKSLVSDMSLLEESFRKAGIRMDARAQDVDLEQFLCMSRVLCCAL